MISTKTELSEFCQAVRSAITAGSQDIKLSSVRERVAESLSYNSVNHLISKLPVSLTDEFWNELPPALLNKHGINFQAHAWAIPYPEHFPLNPSECNTILSRLCDRYKLERVSCGGDMRPDGEGGWYLKNADSYEISVLGFGFIFFNALAR
jgi:hypothetical protein